MTIHTINFKRPQKTVRPFGMTTTLLRITNILKMNKIKNIDCQKCVWLHKYEICCLMKRVEAKLPNVTRYI